MGIKIIATILLTSCLIFTLGIWNLEDNYANRCLILISGVIGAVASIIFIVLLTLREEWSVKWAEILWDYCLL